MGFSDLFPDLGPWVKSLATVWPAPLIKGSSVAFPLIQTFHLLGFVTLGGAIILPALRLMGFGMTSVPSATVEKTVRPWLWAALIILAITGILMGLVIAQRLYTRPAFLAKMVALAASLILSLGVVNSVAKNDGAVTQTAKILAGVALAIWLFSIYVFGWSQGSAPGTFHIVCAAWLIVMGFGSNLTRIILGGLTAAIVIGVGVATYGFMNPLEHYDTVMEINRWTVRLGGLLVAGFLLWEFARPRATAEITPTLARLIGLFTLLSWFTVAAAGRWIGLGGGAN